MSIASAISGMASGGKRRGLAEGMEGTASRPAAAPEPKQDPEEDDGVAGHLTAMQAKMGGKHMHVQSDGYTHTSHQVGEDGKVEGPHEHANLEELRRAMDQFFREEEGEAPENPAEDNESEGLL